MTKLKFFTSEDWVVEAIVKNIINISECQYRQKERHRKMEMISSFKAIL